MKTHVLRAAAWFIGLSSSIVFAGISSAASLCDAVGSGVSFPGLYLVPPGCGHSGCAVPVSGVGEQTACGAGGACTLDRRSGSYNFLVKTSSLLSDTNSIVLVQQYYRAGEGESRRGYGRVVLSRDRNAFACQVGRVDYREPYPSEAEQAGDVLKSVSYENYQYYHHHLGTGGNDEQRMLFNQFHVRFTRKFGGDCRAGEKPPRTDDLPHRPDFLLANRDEFDDGGLRALKNRMVKQVARLIGPEEVDAETEHMREYSQFSVHMTNYSAASGAAGCYSFSVPTRTRGSYAQRGLTKVNIVLRDLELLARMRAAGQTWAVTHPQSWTFLVK